MIAVDQLTVASGPFSLEGVSFAIPTGIYAVLMGPTGSGKTTLLESICGLKPTRAGTIRLLDRDVTNLKPAVRGIGYVPQDGALFPTMTVRQHLAFAPRLRRWESAAIDARTAELATLLGITHLLDRKPQGLSGGETQRVALGRALAFRPGVLCLDEPLSALDEETREEMCVLLDSVRRQTGVTVLHVTHSLAEARRLASLVLRIEHGRVVPEPA